MLLYKIVRLGSFQCRLDSVCFQILFSLAHEYIENGHTFIYKICMWKQRISNPTHKASLIKLGKGKCASGGTREGKGFSFYKKRGLCFQAGTRKSRIILTNHTYTHTLLHYISLPCVSGLQTDLELNNKFQLILDYKNKKLKALPGLLSQSKKKD